jgi:hypothetical protein
VRPDSEGALFWASKSKTENFHFGIDNTRLELDNANSIVKTDLNTVVLEIWQHLAIALEYQSSDRSTLVSFYKNDSVVDMHRISEYLIDWSDDQAEHYIGA